MSDPVAIVIPLIAILAFVVFVFLVERNDEKKQQRAKKEHEANPDPFKPKWRNYE